MIGVIAGFSDQDIVREFFELFKTPWEFWRAGERYDVVIFTGDTSFDQNAKLVLCYAGTRVPFDDLRQVATTSGTTQSRSLKYQGNRIPIYGKTVTFPDKGNDVLVDEESNECVTYIERSGGQVLARIGYDLIGEVHTLLNNGQPTANASIPTLELHIAFLRDLITGHGLPLIEIPPVPHGYRFIACLSHDVDHASIRSHKWDHTTAGFLYRALVGSLLSVIRGQMAVSGLVKNWLAAFKLPLVHLGFAKDFWRDFADRYIEIENGFHSTFFVIPFKNRPGNHSDGEAASFRAVRYGAQDIADVLQKLLAAGCEVGLHGIDAWCDGSSGRHELEEVRSITGSSEIGVRMHWLYYDQESPAILEQAGAAYDSTIGYNETVGYRAGTTQVYKPSQASRLLELPMHVMDTAVFYPGHLGLSPEQARPIMRRLIDNAIHFGGCLTINWHDRSLAPERLWGRFYQELLQDLKNQGAWSSTAGEVVSWFRKRRSVVFEKDPAHSGGVRAKLSSDPENTVPGLRLRVFNGRGWREIDLPTSEDNH